jgi:hypothetical protein
MKHAVDSGKFWIAAFGLLTIVAACRSGVPVKYYTLRAEAVEKLEKAPAADSGPQVVSIGPLTLPEYAHWPQIVTFADDNRLERAEFHRWAGSLREELLRVLAENVSVLLDNPQVVVYPGEAPRPPDCRVILDVRQIEGRLGQSVKLRVLWWASAADRSFKQVGRVSQIEAPAAGPGYEALAAAHSQALLRLSRDIAGAIVSLPTAAGGTK